jgi:hypothetical protein
VRGECLRGRKEDNAGCAIERCPKKPDKLDRFNI